MRTIAFFLRHFLERGTEISIFKLAHYNETILKNKSIILCWTPEQQAKVSEHTQRLTFDRFQTRFTLFECSSIEHLSQILKEQEVDFFYSQPSGWFHEDSVFRWKDKEIWGRVKTIQHSVFSTGIQECDVTWALNECINQKYKTQCPVFPYIVELPEVEGDLREELGIPKDAIVFGGYGGKGMLSIDYVKETIDIFSNHKKDVYFLFANFEPFCSPRPNVMFLPTILDEERKVKFIQSCDAMIWGRTEGETFGLAIAEFSMKNKPVLCCEVGPEGDNAHILLLKEKAVLYSSRSSLMKLLMTFKKETYEGDWNAYREYTPERVVLRFSELLDNLNTE